jgi:hypothetical protein
MSLFTCLIVAPMPGHIKKTSLSQKQAKNKEPGKGPAGQNDGEKRLAVFVKTERIIDSHVYK